MSGLLVMHPLPLSGALTGDPLWAQSQVMGWLLPRYPPSTRILVSTSDLKTVLFNLYGKKGIQLPVDDPGMLPVTRWMVAVGKFPV